MTKTRKYSGLPVALVNGFWDEVVSLLNSRHGLSSVRALRAVLRYRNELDAEDVGDILYHASPTDVADGIFTGGYAKR